MINYHTLFIAFLLRLALGNYVKLNFDVFLDSANLYMYGGSHNDLYIWTIDTEAKYTRISNALYETTDSHSETKVFKGEMTMYLREGEVKGELYEDKFFFDEDKASMNVINNLNYIVYRNNGLEIIDPSVLAFAFKVNKENYSLTHLLKNKGTIDKRQFGIEKDINGGCIYLGGFPDEYVINDSVSKFKVQTRRGLWEIPLSYIYIGNISYVYENVYYENEYNAIMATGTKNILAPKQFYQKYIIDYYLKEYIGNNTCSKKDYGNYDITCKCDDIRYLEAISFIFGNKQFTFTYEDLFYTFEQLCLFAIVQNTKDDEWKFGLTFLLKYKTLFDYDSKSISFYSKDELPSIDLDILFPKNRIIKWISILIVIIVLLFLFIYIRKYIKGRKKRHMNKIMSDVYSKI